MAEPGRVVVLKESRQTLKLIADIEGRPITALMQDLLAEYLNADPKLAKLVGACRKFQRQ